MSREEYIEMRKKAMEKKNYECKILKFLDFVFRLIYLSKIR